MKNKLMITGSCGFIFSNFIRKAIYDQLPYSISSIDKINYDANSIYFNKNHFFHIADIKDQHTIDRIFQYEQPDIVIHGAAQTSIDKSINNPSTFLQDNIEGAQSVINSCIKHKVQKLIYISSASVYGELLSENDATCNEQAEVKPKDPYSISKYTAELLIQSAAKSHNLNYNIIRLSNVYGPRQTTDKFIPSIVKNILQKKDITIYGDGLNLREWTNVSDANSGIIDVLNSGKTNEIYNISSNQEISNLELVQKICNIMGSGFDLIKHIDSPRKIHDFRHAINSSKIRSLGWKPKYKFKDGIAKTIEWYIANQWFLK